MTGYILDALAMSNSLGKPCLMLSTMLRSKWVSPPASPPPEPPHRSSVSNNKLLSPMSFVISALLCSPKTSGLVMLGKHLMKSQMDSWEVSSHLN